MDASVVERGVEGILAEALAAGPETVYVANPGQHTVRRLIESLDADDQVGEIRLLADDAVLKSVMEDFIVASRAADLIDEGVLAMRTTRSETENAVVVTAEQVIALISLNGQVTGLATDHPDFVEGVVDVYADRWEAATDFSLRTPPLSKVHETLGADIGEEVEADFSAVLGSLETARGDGEGLDEVTISLLVAARNDALLYDISKWGEDVGIASKATFSRTKTHLEEKGLIDTEKVPIEVGRPRLRLKLGDERLREAAPDELANVALSVLE